MIINEHKCLENMSMCFQKNIVPYSHGTLRINGMISWNIKTLPMKYTWLGPREKCVLV